MIPNGWKTTHLSELADKISDGLHSTPKYVEESDFYFINGNNLKNGSIRIFDNTKRVSEEEYQIHKKDLNDRTILMSINGTIGNLACYSGELVVLGKSAAYINIKKAVNKEFIFYSLSCHKIQRFFDSELTGTTIRNLSLKSIKATKVDLPPIKEQHKIANILTTWDESIDTVEKLIENSLQQKKSLMQQLLTGEKRFPTFTDRWKKTSISKMGDIVSGGTPDTSKQDYWGSDILWTTPTDITSLKTRFIDSTSRTISESGLKNSSASLLPKGSVLVCTRATIGYLAIANESITTNQGFKSIVPNEDFDSEFIYYLLSFHRHHLVRHACGSTFLELSKKDFAKLKFDAPKLEEQKAISKALAHCDDEIYNLKNQLSQLKQQKSALMQQLLSGKHRVKLD